MPDNWLTQNSQGNPAANINLRSGVEVNPDEAATNEILGRRFGLPAAAIEQDRALFQNRAAAEDARSITFDKPRTQNWVARRAQNAKVAHDDLGVLGAIESAVTTAGSFTRDALLGLAGGVDKFIQDDTPARVSVPELLKQAPRAIASGTLKVASGLAGVGRAASELDDQFDSYWGVQGGEGLGSRFFGNLQRGTNQIAQEVGPDLNKVTGFVGRSILGGLESVPTSIAALGTTIATGNPVLGAGIAGFQVGGDSYGKARDQGVGVNKSLLYGATDATIETATEFLPQLTFLKQTKAGSSVLKRFLTNQFQEQLGEQSATVLQDLNAWAVLPENKDKTFGDYLAARPEAALATAIQTVVVGGATHGAISAVERAADLPAFRARRERVEQAMAEAHSTQLQDILTAASTSTLRERDPVSFQDFMEAQTQDGPLEHVYIDGQVLNQTLEAGGPEAEALLEAMPSIREQLAQAIETGGDVRIPTAELATALPGTAFEQSLTEHLRIDPLAQSAAESRAQGDGTMERMQAGFEEQLAGQQNDAEFNASRDVVTQRFSEQLGAANRFTTDVNEQYAGLLGSFYAVQAAKLGITPETMLERYPLNVRAIDESNTGDSRLGQTTGPDVSAWKAGAGNSYRIWKSGAAEIDYQMPTTPTTDLGTPMPIELDLLLVNPRARRKGAGRSAMQQFLAATDAAGQRVMLTAEPTGDGKLIQRDKLVDFYKSLGFEEVEGTRDMIREPQRLDQKTRGYITFGQDITAQASTITLLNASDLSTFLHEAGHFFLEVQSHMAAQTDAPAGVVDDMAATLKWMGVEGGHAQWLGMTLEQKREHHEKFARGFEAYLFEGKAPTIAMRGVFQRFRSWMVAVYKNNIANLRAPLNDEIRGVFARMIASTDAIQAAEADAQLGPIFTDQPAGMTDVEWQEYQALGISATAEAIDDLQTRSLRDMRFAKRVHARELKRLKAAIADQREQIEDEVRAEISAEPVHRAIEFLRRGTVNGEPVEGPTKFDVAAFNGLYEGFNEQEREAVKKQLGFGKYGMFSKDEGVNPAQVAELFGFSSADELVTTLLKAPDLQSEIDAAVELRMLERYGDINSPEALDAAASAAIHNEVRARFVATELGAMERGVGKPRMLAKAARQFADGMIARLKVRDVRPAQYEAAERRAATAANKALKANDIALATTEKRNQLLNLYATKAARTAQDEIRKSIDYFRKFARVGTRQNIDPAYLDQIDAMLDRFELRTGVSDAALAKRASLAEWIDKQRALGFEPAIDPELENEARRQSYRDLTMDELRGLRDSIKNIEHLGRLKRELLKNKERRELAAAVEAGAAEIRANAYKVMRMPVGARTWIERAKTGVDEFFAIHRKFASLIREMSANQDGGVLWDLFTRPMNDAGNAEAVMTADATEKLHTIFKRLQSDNTFKRVYEPAIDASISLETRLMVALNWGNSTNRQRIMGGEGWTIQQVEAVLAPLTEEHWQFVKDVWSHVNSYWPEVAAKEKRVTGVEPEKVESEAFTFTTSDGKTIALPGGYFPIKYDPDKSSKAEADTAAEVQRQITQGLYTRATTRRGHTKARVETVERSLRKDFSVIFQHNGEVIHDLAWHETLIDMNRLLGAGQIDEAIREHYGPAVLRAMRKSLEDIAVGGIPATNVLERGVNYLRAGATVAGLGWNLMTSLFQPLGLTSSVVRIGPKYVARGIGRVFRDAASMEATTTWVYAQSDFMRLRAQTQQREIAEIRQQFAAKGPIRSTLDRVPGVAPTLDVVGGSFFVLITKAQLIADVPTWTGMYEKQIDEGQSHERAVALADQAVIDSQGGGQIKDLAGVQRGGAFQKLWTNFYSWFNVAYNQLAESTNNVKRVGPSGVPLLAVDFLLIAVVPALMASLMRAAIAGDDDDELKKRILNDQLGGYLGFMFGMRELGAMFGVGAGYTGPAGARAIDASIKLGKQVQQGDADEAFFKALNNAGGVLFHYPAGQVQRTYLGVEALADGKTKNPLVILTGPPKKDK